VIFKARNVELIKKAIVLLREELYKNRKINDKINTSTLICITKEESEKKIEKFSKLID
jgi:hypothetical protein